MPIEYGPDRDQHAVWHGGRLVRRYETPGGARAAAYRRAARFGGEVVERVAEERVEPPASRVEPPPQKPPVSAEEIGALTIGALRDRLARGDLDEHLDRLEEAEKAGAARKGALEVIEERRSQ